MYFGILWPSIGRQYRLFSRPVSKKRINNLVFVPYGCFKFCAFIFGCFTKFVPVNNQISFATGTCFYPSLPVSFCLTKPFVTIHVGEKKRPAKVLCFASSRSHTLAVRKRPSDLQNVRIHNLNVRGKRGNIVQVYPGVEYDFVPNTLLVKDGDYVHFQ